MKLYYTICDNYKSILKNDVWGFVAYQVEDLPAK